MAHDRAFSEHGWLRKALAAGVLTTLGGTLVQKISRIGTEVLLTHTLLPASYGQYAVGMSIFLLMTPIVTLGTEKSLVRFGAGTQHSDRAWNREVSAAAFGNVIGALAVPAACIAILYLSGLSDKLIGSNNYTILYFCLALVPLGLTRLCAAIRQASGDVAGYVLRDRILPYLGMFTATAVATVFGRDAQAMALAACLGAAGALVVAAMGDVPRQIVRSAKHFEPRSAFQHLRFGGAVVFTAALYVTLTETDRLMLAWLAGPRATGIYTPASRLGYQAGLVIALFPPMVSPLAARAFRRRRIDQVEELLRTSSRWIAIITLPIVLALTCYAALILRTVFGRHYEAGAFVLAVLATSKFVGALPGNAGLVLQMGGRQRLEVVNTVGVVIANVTLNALLIPRWGIDGAAIATGVSLILVNVIKAAEVWWLWRITAVHFVTVVKTALIGSALVVVIRLVGGQLVNLQFQGFLFLLLSLGLFFGSYALACWYLVFDVAERRFLIASVRRLAATAGGSRHVGGPDT